MRTRYLFLIETEHYDYDQYSGFVISAESVEQARHIAERAAAPTGQSVGGKGVFATPSLSKIRQIGISSAKQGVVLGSFYAG